MERLVWCEFVDENLSRLGDPQGLLPLGYEPPSLVDAAADAHVVDPKPIVQESRLAGERAASATGSADVEGAAAIALYLGQHSDVSDTVNEALSTRSDPALNAVRGFLVRLLRALRALPRVYAPNGLFRAVPRRVRLFGDHFVSGHRITWHSFVSTTTSRAEAEALLTDEDTGDVSGTIFVISGPACWGYDVHHHSPHPRSEVLIEPETDFLVRNVQDGPLVVVELEMIEGPLLFERAIPWQSHVRTTFPLAASPAVAAAAAPITMLDFEDPEQPPATVLDVLDPDILAIAGGDSAPRVGAVQQTSFSVKRGRLSATLSSSSTLLTGSGLLSASVTDSRLVSHSMDVLELEMSAGDPAKIAEAIKKLAEDINTMELATGVALSASFSPAVAASSSRQPAKPRKKEVASIVAAMQKHSSTEAVAEQGCAALASIATNSETWPAIMESGGLECLVGTLRSHGSSATVCEKACSAISKLALGSQSRSALVKQGAIELVIGTLRAHLQAVVVCEKACIALTNFAISDANAAEIARHGGIEAVAAALKQHGAGSALLSEKACATFWNLTFAPENKVAVAKAGGIELILGALSTHEASVAVCSKACAALCNLSTVAENKAFILRLGGSARIIDALRKHLDSPSVCEQACGALGNLALHAEDVKQAIAKGGGANAILQALRRHVESTAVCQMASGALKNLAFGCSFCQKLLGKELAHVALLDVLRQHGDNAAVVQFACGALAAMAKKNSDNKSAIKKVIKADKQLKRFSGKIFP